MPSLIDIRRRVRAVKSTQQITKAMKMVSSSKLRRAQERIVRSRPYAKEMLRVFNNLATRVDPSKHPLLNDDPQSGRTLLIVITADRGLCGSFNTNIIKSAVQFTLDQPKGPQGQDVALALVGRKGRDFFMRRGFDVLYACQDLEFDRAHGLNSIPVRFGVAQSLRISRVMHVATIACMAALAWLVPLGPVYLGGVVLVAALLLYEQSLVSEHDLSQVKKAFDLNGWVGILYFLTTGVELYVR